MLEGLACSKAERVAELKKRKQRFQQIKAHPADREKMIAEGWSATGRELKDGRLVFEKSKTHDEILENRFWSVLYYLGYDELNAGRKFKIQITDTKSEKDVSKQVDVFAKDDDTVIIAECKSAATKSARNLQKDIMEFAALQRSIVRTVVSHYGRDERLLSERLIEVLLSYSRTPIIKAFVNSTRVSVAHTDWTEQALSQRKVNTGA